MSTASSPVERRQRLLELMRRTPSAPKVYPLSFSQSRLWFLDQIEEDFQPSIHEVLVLDGPLRVDGLERAWRRLVQRQESLRTVFIPTEGEALQVVLPRLPMTLPVLDLQGLGLGSSAAMETAEAALERALGIPFDLRKGPLFRLLILRLGPERHLWLLQFHHIVFDGWSVGVLHRDLSRFYEEEILGERQDRALPALPVAYGQFSKWQRDRLEGEHLERLLAYWRRRLDGLDPVLELPADRPRPPRESRRGGLAGVQWSPSLAAAIENHCRATGTTPFVFLLTAFQILLSRLSGRRDVAVGFPVAGRPRADLEDLVGFFVNSLVLRTSIAGNPSFEELRQQVGGRVVEALDHGELPFEKLVEELRPPRDLGAAPIYQVSFQVQNAEVMPPRLAGLEVTQEERNPGTAAIDLAVYLEPRQGGLRGFVQFSRDLFDGTTAQRLARSLHSLASAAVGSPGARVYDMPLLTAEEAHQLEIEGQGLKAKPPAQGIVEGILLQARRRPDALAVVCEGETVTYGDLGQEVLALAVLLKSHGAGPEVPVGVCLPRSLAQVKALLAVFAVGAAYLPLDPAYPDERLRVMVDDCAAPIVLGNEIPGARAVTVPLGASQDRTGSASFTPASARPENIACLLFTSGSTGKPKAVALPYGGLESHCRSVEEVYQLSSLDVVLQFASAGFDTALEQTLPALTVGAKVVMRGGHVWTAEELFSVVQEEGITVANLTTSYWQQVISAWAESDMSLSESALRLVIAGGEQMALEGVRAWSLLSDGPGPRLLNAYGPTETTVTATLGSPQGTEASARLGIGRPLPGRVAAIVDARGRTVPMGVAGELLLGGAGLARGYLGKPGLTAERFLPASGPTPGARAYATGDLARWRADGQLEIVGRRDRQVKLRGFRIELGEIEAALEGLPLVRQAVAMVRRDSRGEMAAVAFVVPASGGNEAADSGSLKASLSKRLPAFLVPSRIELLPALPLTTNGKVDLRALESWDLGSLERGGDIVTSGELEVSSREAEKVVEIWRDVLGLEQAHGDQHFFDLGGHSLLATRLVSRINRELSLSLTVRTVFEAPRLDRLLQSVEGATPSRETGPALTAIPRTGGGFPVSYSQERMWFLDRLTPGSPLYSIAGQLRLAGQLDVRALEASLKALIERHESFRTVFPEVNALPLQEVRQPATFTLASVDISGLGATQGEVEGRNLAERMSRLSFELSTGPLLRVCLLRRGASLHRLVVVLHHIVSDGWSQGVFFRELSEFYSAHKKDRAPHLPPLPVQYVDYATWQRKSLDGERLDTLMEFWRRTLASPLPILELPADRPRPPLPSFEGAFQTFQLGMELSQELEHWSRTSGTTIFMILLAGLKTILWRLTGQRDLLVGTPVANRNQPELERVIGFFVNTLVLRTRIPVRGRFVDLLDQVQETTLEASKYQEVPFERLVAELLPDRDLSHSPFFQVMLAHQDASVGSLTMAGLEVTLEPLSSATSKFDLTVYVRETEAGLVGALEYSTDLFDKTTMGRLAESLKAVFRAVTEDPQQPLASLPLLSPQERWQIRGEWNGAATSFGPPRGLHELVEEQVDRTPEAIAVVLADGDSASDQSLSLTYAQLDRRANRLARFLRSRGVGPEDLVGVALERSVDLVVALLGVLKAGAAYVPMDPASPPQRLAMMIEDTGMAALLAREDHWRTLNGVTVPKATKAVFMDRDRGWIEAQGDRRLGWQGPPEGLAYVIYTSGSTGKPKGAMNRHRGIFNRLQWMQQAYGLGPEDRVLQKTPFTFDVSVWEFFWPLMVGARLVMARPGGHGDPAYLARAVREQGVTTMHFVPSVLGSFLDAPGVHPCTSLLRVICSGEALSRELVQRFHGTLRAELHNLYGPTEAAIDVTAWPCPAGEEGAVPIGRPIANTSAFVLDRQGQISPIGGEGELFLGGPNLGRGYYRRPSLTADRFRPNPFSAKPGSRLYATGDRARWRRDGALDFLGRLDFQVKLRGLRIELGEIETALEALPSVRSAVVVVREVGDADQRLVAYVVGAEAKDPAENELRAALRRSLPEYMVPGLVIVLAEFPLNANGKLDRGALPTPMAEGSKTPSAAPRQGLARDLAAIWSDVLGLESVSQDRSFFDLGGHSLLLVQVQNRLRSDLGLQVELVELFQFPTICALADHLHPDAGDRAPGVHGPPAQPREQAVAIVGMSGRFPGASSVEELWENLVAGKDSISFFSDEELESSPLLAGDPSHPDFVKAGGIVEGAELFDADFFGYTPREAEILDPQQRLFLECSWEALEAANCDPVRFPGRIGVFAGVGMNSYLFTHLMANPEALQAAGGYAATLANDKDFLASRVSYKLGLRGPSVAVQTACSTSLVAVHMACRAIQSGDCDLALAGGVTIRLPQRSGYQYQPSMILSADGRCRAFDASAGGTVPGNGVGIVVLKSLSRAVEDGDEIIAVIRGSAVNNDGAEKVGFTAPGVTGQAEVIAEALGAAGVSPASVTYVEAHGTATELGDPIEVAALTQAFRAGTKERGYCGLGSVKSNLGHLDAAAGVAGLIKTALSLSRRYLPPTLHIDEPSPHIDFESSPFFLQATGGPWRSQGVLRAGVSSFGIGGTNAHVVVEEHPSRGPSSSSRPLQLLVFSAATPAALDEAGKRLADALEQGTLSLPDAAFSLQVGRQRLAHRRTVVAPGKEQATELLRTGGKDSRTRVESRSRRPIAFLLPGQGAQYPAMGADLYHSEATFREVVDRCIEALREPLGFDLGELLIPPVVAEDHARRLQQTSVAQPALFTIELALVTLWREWGLEPEALLGHSIGELVAATISGVFSFEDAVKVVALRGRLMQEMPSGAMTSISAAVEAVEGRLVEGVELAAVNSPGSCVVSGPEEALATFEEELTAAGIEHRRLHTSHAFHSSMMEPAMELLREALEGMDLADPKIPFLSNVTGQWIRSEEARDPGYWARQLRGTVRFSENLEHLLRIEDLLLVEAGPGEVLTSIVKQHEGADALVVPSLPRPGRKDSPLNTMLSSLGRLWLAGADVDWHGFYRHEERRRVPLPSYPFQRKRFLVEPRSSATSLLQEMGPPPIEEWFSLPSWRRSGAALGGERDPGKGDPATWLVFLDSQGLGGEMLELLRRRGDRVVTVSAGEGFLRLAEGTFLVNPTSSDDHRALLRALDQKPDYIFHLWCLAPRPRELPGSRSHGKPDLECVLALMQALILELDSTEVELGIVSSGLHLIDSRDSLDPERSLILGPCKVLQQEHPHLSCRSIDVSFAEVRTGSGLARALLAEMEVPASDGVAVAYRGGRRWIESVESLRLPPAQTLSPRLRERGVYLITGGLGNVGLVLAAVLARIVPSVRLVLLGRSDLPEAGQRQAWLDRYGPEHPVSQKILRVRELEVLGAQVLVLRANVAQRTEMARALHRAEEVVGQIHGIIHAAGLAGKSLAAPIMDLAAGDVAAHLEAKVDGLRILKELLEERTPDFLLVTSSTSALLGGLGLSLYSAANLYLDAMVEKAAAEGQPWISINWDGWAFEAANHRSAQQHLSLTPKTGAEAFLRVLSAPQTSTFSRILVSPRRLEPLMDEWLRVENLRRKLAGPRPGGEGFGRPELSQAYVAPSTHEEEVIAEIWHQLLGIEPIGVNDDFFELGGHSLLATQLLSRMRDQLGVEMTLDQVFERPTVAELAKVGDDLEASGYLAAASPIARLSREKPLRLSFAQERMWLLYRFDPDGIAYNLPAAIRLRGDLDIAALQRTYACVVERHEILRTRFLEVEGRPRQEVLETVSYQLPVIDLSKISREKREQMLRALAVEQGNRPFDLGAGEVFRNVVLRFSPRHHAFLSACHHIVTDGWSGGLSVAEIASLYPAFSRGERISLPPLPFQFADFAEWQREWLSGEVLESLLGYWREQLKDRPALPSLPTDRPRKAGGRSAGRTEFTIGADTVAALRRLARKLETSLFMISMAGLMTLLHRCSGEDDISVGTAVASRHLPGTEHLLGVFINTLVIRASLAENPLGEELLAKVRQASLGAYAHQDLPFDKLVESLQPPRDPSGQTFFRVLMAFNHEPPPTPHLEGLDLEVLDLGPREDEAMFDLSLGLTDEGEILSGSLQFNSALFDLTTVQRWMRSYGRVLAGLADGSGMRLSELSLLGSGERHQVAVEWPALGLATGDGLGGETRLLQILGSLGELLPIGVWGAVQLAGSPATAPAPRGRYLASGRLEMDTRTDEAPSQQGDQREVLAQKRWREIEDRQHRLSARKKKILEERLAGRLLGGGGGKTRRTPTEASSEVNGALVAIQASGERPPLFCVHAVAGDVTSYLELAAGLGGDQPFYGLQAPGLGEEQAAFRTLQDMASHYVKAVRRARPQGPYVLAGWSMGGVVAFEMAQQIRRTGGDVSLLVLLEPAVPGLGKSSAVEAGIASLVQDLESRLGRRLPPAWREMAGTGQERQARYLLQLAQEQGLKEAGGVAGDWPQLLEVYQNNVTMLQSYHPEPYAGEAILVTVEHGPQRQAQEDPRLFWRRLVGQNLGLFHVAGSHTSMLRSPYVEELANLLRRSLDLSLARS